MNNMSDRLTTLAEVCNKLSYIIFEVIIKVVWEKLLKFKGNLYKSHSTSFFFVFFLTGIKHYQQFMH